MLMRSYSGQQFYVNDVSSIFYLMSIRVFNFFTIFEIQNAWGAV